MTHSNPDGPSGAHGDARREPSAEQAEALVDTGREPDAPGAPPPQPGATAATADSVVAARERDEYYDLLLRKTAEFDNYKKRVERERRELADHVAGEIVKELLPVLDDFSRARAASAGTTSADALRQGLELVHRRLLDVLAKRGVTVLDPLGETFDPHLHEAVARVPAEDGRDGEIVEVFSPGYTLGDRLLRPAMVKVATA